MKPSDKAAVQVIASGVLWALISIFIRRLNACGLTALQIAMLRLMLSALCLGLFLALRCPEKLRIRPADLPLFIGTGIVSVVLFNVFYFRTILLSEASVAVVLLYTSPVFVMLLSAALFHERITAAKLISLVLTVGGCVLVSGMLGHAALLSPAVLLTGIGSGLFYALYSIFGRIALRRYDSLTVTFWTFLMGAAGSLPLGDLPRVLKGIGSDPGILLWGIGIAVVSTILPYILYTAGLEKLDTGRAAILVAVEPLVAAVLGILAYGESTGLPKLAGIAMILCAIVLMNLPEKTGAR